MYKLLYIFLPLLLFLTTPARAEPAPKLDFYQIKNTSRTSTSFKADVIFKSAINDSNYYIKKDNVIPFKKLAPIARRRLFCGTPATMVVCAVGTNIAYEYFSDELGLRDFNYNVDTGTFEKPIPNGYKISFVHGGNEYSSVSSMLSDIKSKGGYAIVEQSQQQKAKLESGISSIDYSKLLFNKGTATAHGVTATYSFSSDPEAYSSTGYFSVRVNDARIEGVEYDAQGKPLNETMSMTQSQFDAMLEQAISKAPQNIQEDLIMSNDFIAEGHDILVELAPQAVPYDYVTGEILEAQPDGEINPYIDGVTYPHPDTGVIVNPKPNTNPDPDPNPNPNTGGFSLPSFCSWAKPVCDLADFFQREEPDTEDTEVDIDELPFEDKKVAISFGDSQCPADFEIPFNFGGKEFKYVIPMTPMCEVAGMLKVPLIIVSMISYMYIVSGSRE